MRFKANKLLTAKLRCLQLYMTLSKSTLSNLIMQAAVAICTTSEAYPNTCLSLYS